MTTCGLSLTCATSPSLTLSEKPESDSPRSSPLREKPLETRGMARKSGAASSRMQVSAQAEKNGKLRNLGVSRGLRLLSFQYSTCAWREVLLAAKASPERRISYPMNAETAAKR